ncbi:MAG: hypothetical protein AAGF73_11180 [Actinomycetota bacterium]
MSSSTANGVQLPVFTLYGDGTAIAITQDGWVTDVISSLTIQDYLADAESAGLLDGPLTLRQPGTEAGPDIEAEFNVDGESITHAIDVARVDESSGLWAFLLRSATRNQFGLDTPFAPTAWVSCDATGCALTDEPGDGDARPVLPHENSEQVLAESATQRSS